VNDNGKIDYSAAKAVSFELQFLFAPNPSSGNITINADVHLLTKVEIVDTQGKLVFNTTINGLTKVNLAHLPEGVYILKVSSGGMVNFDKLILENTAGFSGI
jgi:hypothetical protein